MKIVIAQHKGGIGKTSLAVHVAGILGNNSIENTLVIDCDTQGDAFRFFTGLTPNKELYVESGKDGIDVMWNPRREKLATKNRYDEYDNIVVDINTRFQDSLQVIIELVPDLILIPVDRQLLSTEHIYEVITSITMIQGNIAYPADVRIVQMGCEYNLNSILDDIPGVPDSCYEDYRIPYLYDVFNRALIKSEYVWEYTEHENLKTIFEEVVGNGE